MVLASMQHLNLSVCHAAPFQNPVNLKGAQFHSLGPHYYRSCPSLAGSWPSLSGLSRHHVGDLGSGCPRAGHQRGAAVYTCSYGQQSWLCVVLRMQPPEEVSASVRHSAHMQRWCVSGGLVRGDFRAWQDHVRHHWHVRHGVAAMSRVSST